MYYQQLYWNSAIIYILAAIGFFFFVKKITSFLPRVLSWLILWFFVCLVLTPWRGTEPEVYYAPAIIVAAFDFLDLGLESALDVIKPIFQVWVVGAICLVIVAIFKRIRELKSSEDQAA